MGGVGTFSRDNRTLYIGGIRRVKGVDLQELVARNFIEWGELESVRVIWDKSIAFVRYKLRAAAEFAKEAMADQSLGYKEILNVRWANEDPNPRAKAEKAFDLADQVYNTVMATQGPAQYPDMSTLTTGDIYPVTDDQYAPSAPIPDDYQQALQYASTYIFRPTHDSNGNGDVNPPDAIPDEQQQSSLSLLSAYDVESYAERYGSSSSPAAAAESSSVSGQPQETTTEAPAVDQSAHHTFQHQQYTPEQWKQWYMYYYGYVPASLPTEQAGEVEMEHKEAAVQLEGGGGSQQRQQMATAPATQQGEETGNKRPRVK